MYKIDVLNRMQNSSDTVIFSGELSQYVNDVWQPPVIASAPDVILFWLQYNVSTRPNYPGLRSTIPLTVTDANSTVQPNPMLVGLFDCPDFIRIDASTIDQLQLSQCTVMAVINAVGEKIEFYSRLTYGINGVVIDLEDLTGSITIFLVPPVSFEATFANLTNRQATIDGYWTVLGNIFNTKVETEYTVQYLNQKTIVTFPESYSHSTVKLQLTPTYAITPVLPIDSEITSISLASQSYVYKIDRDGFFQEIPYRLKSRSSDIAIADIGSSSMLIVAPWVYSSTKYSVFRSYVYSDQNIFFIAKDTDLSQQAFDVFSRKEAIEKFVDFGYLAQVIAELEGRVAKMVIVTDLAERDAIEIPAINTIYVVLDATADPTVETGGASYLYLNGAWEKYAEFESIDVYATTFYRALSEAEVTAKQITIQGICAQAALELPSGETVVVTTVINRAENVTVINLSGINSLSTDYLIHFLKSKPAPATL